MDPTKRRFRKIDRDAQRFVAQALGNTDLSLSDYDMIHAVRHRPGITQEELRRLYCLDKSTIARRAAKLEEAGYIRRRPSPEDKRRKELFVTEKGDALREAKVEAEAFYFDWLTAELTEAELALLRRLGETPFLPAAASYDRKVPVYLEDRERPREECAAAILGLAGKGLARLDYDIP